MNKKILSTAKKMAHDAGFHDVRVLGKWKGYEVAETIFTDNEIHFIGYPQYLLVKGADIRWTKDYNESLELMSYFDK